MAEKRKPIMTFNIRGPFIKHLTGAGPQWATGKQKGTETLCIELYRATDWNRKYWGSQYVYKIMDKPHNHYRMRMNGRWFSRRNKEGEVVEKMTFLTIYEVRDIIWRSVVRPLNTKRGFIDSLMDGDDNGE